MRFSDVISELKRTTLSTSSLATTQSVMSSLTNQGRGEGVALDCQERVKIMYILVILCVSFIVVEKELLISLYLLRKC